jgi:hypothetical protein
MVVKTYDFETFKVGWAKDHPFGEWLPTMGLDKTFGFRPGQKCLFGYPCRMRDIVNSPVVTLPAEELKGLEAWRAL